MITRFQFLVEFLVSHLLKLTLTQILTLYQEPTQPCSLARLRPRFCIKPKALFFFFFQHRRQLKGKKKIVKKKPQKNTSTRK